MTLSYKASRSCGLGPESEMRTHCGASRAVLDPLDAVVLDVLVHVSVCIERRFMLVVVITEYPILLSQRPSSPFLSQQFRGNPELYGF